MVAGQVPPDIVRARLAALLNILVDVVKDKQPVDIIRSREPVQHVRHHDPEVLFAAQDSVPALLGNLAFRYPRRTASKALHQPVL
jgi:hypothetical protein